jgi:ComF family protein
LVLIATIDEKLINELSVHLLSILRRFLAPRHDCVLCSVASPDWVCDACARALPHASSDVCPNCAAHSAHSAACGACIAHPPQFDAAVAAFRYRFPVDQLLHGYKYASQIALAGFFCDHLARAAQRHEAPHVVCAIPLSRERLAERGFNQASLLADGTAKHWRIRPAHGLLRRVRNTQPQAELDWASRQANVKGAFECEQDLSGKHVALFDDVMTTGATLNEAAKVLKRNGAVRVSVWVAARADRGNDAATNGGATNGGAQIGELHV